MSAHDALSIAIGGLFGFAFCAAAYVIGASAAEAWRWHQMRAGSIQEDDYDYD